MQKVLIVEDDRGICLALNKFLKKNDYDVREAHDGAMALEVSQDYQPDIILLDVNMPVKDGYETCVEIKAAEATKDTPVIFVSGNITTEERVKGYESGGDDYLTKPVDYNLLLIKIEQLLKHYDERRNLNKQVSESSQVALNAMTYTSNLGAIVQFLEKSLDCITIGSLAELTLETTQSFGLNCCMQVIKGGNRFNYGIPYEASPIETQIMSAVAEAGRFFDFGARSVVQFGHFVLLVKNMPTHDEAAYGSMKDVLATLGNAADARIKSIFLAENLARQRSNLLDTLKKVLDIVKAQYKGLSTEFIGATDEMIKETETALHELGLMEYQEKDITDIMDKFHLRVQTSLDKGLEMDKYFDNIRQVLDKSYSDIKGEVE